MVFNTAYPGVTGVAPYTVCCLFFVALNEPGNGMLFQYKLFRQLWIMRLFLLNRMCTSVLEHAKLMC